MKSCIDIEYTIEGLKRDLEELQTDYLHRSIYDEDYGVEVAELSAKIEALEWVLDE